MVRDREPHGPFVSTAAAAYPGELNRAFAELLLETARTSRRVSTSRPSKAAPIVPTAGLQRPTKWRRLGLWGNALVACSLPEVQDTAVGRDLPA